MMNSFYWTQSLLVILVAILAFFISFGPIQNRAKWLTALGIAASVALFVANQVVMSNTGDGLDKQLNCLIWPSGVACPKPSPATALQPPPAKPTPIDIVRTPPIKPPPSKLSAQASYEQAEAASKAEDFIQARTLFKDACDGGSAQACYRLGSLWSSGIGGDFDKEIAADFYAKGCDGRSGEACTQLGIMYSNNYDFAKDEAKARSLYQRACDSRYATGCTLLGLSWRNGTGGRVNTLLAREILTKACFSSDDINGCSSLGSMWEYGIGGATNKSIARGIYKRGCDTGGDPDGCSALERLESE
jgi:hypothetical protein